MAGTCVDQMNEPPDCSFAHKVRTTGPTTVELGGIIWAYMGPRENMPPLPEFEWTQMPATHRHVSKVIEECNWLQGPRRRHRYLPCPDPASHHLGEHQQSRCPIDGAFCAGQGADSGGGRDRLRLPLCRHPSLEEDETYVRTYHYIMPFTQIRPQQFRYRGREPAGGGPLLGAHGR